MKIVNQKIQAGFTLIELMIALATGLLVAIAAVQLFVTAFSSYNLQRGLGDVNENGRFGIDYIARNIRVSEYAKDVNTTGTTAEDSAVVTAVSQLPGSPAGFVSADNSSTFGIGTSDQLVVRTWVPDTMPNQRDCEGNIINVGSTGVYSVSRYFLRADTTSGSGSALACDAGTYGAIDDASMTGYGDDGVVLLASVDNFQVLYGVSADATSTFPVRYVTSAQYTALVPQPRIVAIRFGVLVRSSDGVGNLAIGSPTINVLDNQVTGASQDSANAKLIRRVFVSTVALRNVMQ